MFKQGSNGETTADARRTDPLLRLALVPRGIPPIDYAIASGLAIWAVLEALFAAGSGTTIERLACALAMTLPVLTRRRWPVQGLAVIALAVLVRNALGDTPEAGTMPMPVMFVMGFSVALYARPPWLAVVVAPVPIAIMWSAQFEGQESVIDYAIGSFILLGAWAAGWAVRQRANQVREARDLAPQLAEEAVAAERTRMARELHDVVAHSVSIIAVQSGAAEANIDRDPERAKEHMATVRASAHEALVELRRLVGLLREEDASYAPQPGLSRLEDLLDESRSSGMQIELERSGDPVTLPVGLDLTAYRVIQESLTNVRKHAGGAATVVGLDTSSDAVKIAVVNRPGAPAATAAEGSGQGLIGMQERVRIYGGTFSAAATDDGGFAVRVVLPIDEAPR
jgi:signal transduction histidine kinase